MAQFAASSVVETACRSTYQSGNEVMIAGSVHADRLYLKTHPTALIPLRSKRTKDEYLVSTEISVKL